MVVTEDIANEMLETIPVIMQAMRAEVRAYRSHDLSVPQFRTLGFLRRRPGSSLAELAEHIGLTSSSACALVDGLVGKGLVLRTESPEDRRRVELRLTAPGLELLEGALRGARQSLVERLEGLSAEQREQIRQAMKLLRPLYESPAGVGRK